MNFMTDSLESTYYAIQRTLKVAFFRHLIVLA